MRIEKIRIDAILFASNRKYGGEGEIEILAADMRENGMINPITVKELPKEIKDGGPKKGYEVVAGRRRIMAAILLGWKEISSCILEGDEVSHADEIAGSENINRLAMHPLDEAKVFSKLLQNGQTIEELAKRYDRKASAIWQRLQLLGLNEDIKTLFRKGHLSLHSAAMLKSLNEKAQEAFVKQFKNDWAVKNNDEIEEHRIRNFISNLGYDRLYGFLKDKQCAECKTRTYFGDKNLFPELDNVSDSCLNHECYMQKWDKILTNRIKSLKGEHKSHAAACLIVTSDDKVKKILGAKVTIDGTEFNILPYDYYSDAKAKDAGAHPCFNIRFSGSGKLEIGLEYWKKPEKGTSGLSLSPASKRKDFAPVVKVLDLPKAEMDEKLDALENRKRLTPNGFNDNIRNAVFWRIMDIKAQEFNDPKKADSISKEMFLKKHLACLHGNGKRIFEMFAGNFNGKETITNLSKLSSEKVFMLLSAMEWSEWELPTADKYEKKPFDILNWAGISNEKLKQLYQEEILKRIPKKKPEAKKPAEKKQAKPKTPAVKKTTATKKTPRKKLPSAKHIKAVNAAKGKGKKKQ